MLFEMDGLCAETDHLINTGLQFMHLYSPYSITAQILMRAMPEDLSSMRILCRWYLRKRSSDEEIRMTRFLVNV
jgi:hypothetical protein